ncbi:hypothetical protein LCGC14_2240160 [marine sediment metagenome]|uniref:PseI/NeuA/B-like domain-containing protein n=1 Tax=marine sediment metagenome TaxID=412755 RepID=A0A0F9D5E1_9ZZZZ
MSNYRPIFIVAEIGINHGGDLSKAKELIEKAKASGAEAAKFQLYDPRQRPDIEEHPFKEVLLKSKLTKRMLYELKEMCDRNYIEFMCSVFDVERVGWLEEIRVERYKIASKCVYDKELIGEILLTGKDIIVSSGYLDAEIGWPDNLLEAWVKQRVSYLYCVSKYPATLKDLDLRNTVFSPAQYVGYSDHTIGITACLLAMCRGARIIEKHLTLDKMADGPDHILSALPDELELLCKFRDEIERILYL